MVFAVKKILGELFPQLPFAQTTPAAATPPQLSGAPSQESQPADAKYNAVEGLANALYSDPNLTEKDINEIAEAISQRTKAKQQQPAPPQTAEKQSPVVNFYTGEEDGENV